jgi:hypothetical protein
MQYRTKSVVIGRMKRKNKDDSTYPCFIHLFSINDPQKTAEVPDKMLDYADIDEVRISGLDVNYLLAGNDLVINDLESIDVNVTGSTISVKGKQKR